MFVVMDDILAFFYSFLWPFTRISAALLVAPVFSARSVSIRLRIVLAAALTFIVYPLYEWPVIDVLTGSGFVLFLQQIALGILMGFILQIAFAAISAAGDYIAVSMGLSFAMMADPNNGHQTPILSQLFVIIATLLFLTVGAHLVLIEMLLDSFRLIPVDEIAFNAELVADFLRWTSIIFTGGMMIALPAMMTLLVKNMAMGVVSRAAPSLNVFAVGFPAAMLVGFVSLVILMPSMTTGMQSLWVDGYSQIQMYLGVR
jgi:flagellar biosynthetic protein FliR